MAWMLRRVASFGLKGLQLPYGQVEAEPFSLSRSVSRGQELKSRVKWTWHLRNRPRFAILEYDGLFPEARGAKGAQT